MARDGPTTYRIYYSDKWKFFPDFLRDYVPEVFGIEWCKAEAPKPEAERHPVITWRAQGAAYMNAQLAQPDGSRAPECHLGGTGPDDIRLPALAPSPFVRGSAVWSFWESSLMLSAMDLNMRSRTSAKVAEHCLDIVQALVICRFSPFNGRGVTPPARRMTNIEKQHSKNKCYQKALKG